MSNYFTVLKALFRNKYRFGAETTRGKAIGMIVALGIVYALIVGVFMSLIFQAGDMLVYFSYSLYYVMLMTAALFVLIFGIITLINVVFLSKDTDFYSSLPIKHTTVFAAKLSFVYLSEAVISAAVLLPLFIALGAYIKAGAIYYVLSLLSIFIIPAYPLTVAAIISVPVMFIASKVKNRGLFAILFYALFFGAYLALYMYFMFSSSTLSLDAIESAQKVMQYTMYPYVLLADAVFGLPVFGLSASASTAVNYLLFLAISAALVAILLVLAKFLYAKGAKANNQTDNSKAKKGEFKSVGVTRALIKREYKSALRTTQVTFQCYVVYIIPVFIAIFLGVMFRNLIETLAAEGAIIDPRFFRLIAASTLALVSAAICNAAGTTFSREGSAFASLKTLPINVHTLIKAKLFAWLVFGLPASTAGAIIAGALLFEPGFFVLTLFAVLPLSAVYMVFAVLWDLKAPKIKWTDPVNAIKHNMHVIGGQFICMAPGFLALALCVMLFSAVSMDTVYIVCWAILYATIAVFAVVDILLYRRSEAYFDRVEA